MNHLNLYDLFMENFMEEFRKGSDWKFKRAEQVYRGYCLWLAAFVEGAAPVSFKEFGHVLFTVKTWQNRLSPWFGKEEVKRLGI